MTKQKKGSSSNERSLSEMQKAVRKPHAASHLPALYPYSSSLWCNNKAGQTACVGLGHNRAAGAALGMDLETSRFHLLLFHTKIVEVLSPDLFCPICLEKCIGFMEGASKSHLTLLTSQHCFTREVSANIYNKNFFTLVQPMILLFFSCCDKGSSHR